MRPSLPRPTVRHALATVAVLPCLVLAACGGSSSGSGSTVTQVYSTAAPVSQTTASTASTSARSTSTAVTVASTFSLAPAIRARLTLFAKCMRAHGQPLPNPNPNGSTVLFNLGHVNTRTAAYQAASLACRKSVGSPLL